MPFNSRENISADNPRPVQEVSGTYNRYEPISASNPFPVMEVVDGEYSGYGDISQTNPQPVAIIADSGTYTKYEDESDSNAFPVKFITGQSYDPRLDVSETNPWPVVVISGGGGEEYVGPLDLVPGADWIVAFSSARALSSAKRGTENYIIKELTGDTSQGFSSDAVTGLMDTAAISAFIGGGAGGATWWQNQSDTEAHVTNALQPGPLPWVASSQGGRPAFGSGIQMRSTATVPVLSGGATMFIVAKGAVDLDIDQTDVGYAQTVGGAAAYVDLYDYTNEAGGDYVGHYGDDVYCVLVSTVEQGENVIYVNGTALRPERNDYDSGVTVGPINAAEVMLNFGSEAQEFLAADGILSSVDIQAVVENMGAFFGITICETAPAITPNPAVAGDLLSVTTGTWGAGANPVYTYQWWVDASPVGGATNSTYQTTNPGQIGLWVTCVVTNTNDDGSGFAVSNRITLGAP